MFNIVGSIRTLASAGFKRQASVAISIPAVIFTGALFVILSPAGESWVSVVVASVVIALAVMAIVTVSAHASVGDEAAGDKDAASDYAWMLSPSEWKATFKASIHYRFWAVVQVAAIGLGGWMAWKLLTTPAPAHLPELIPIAAFWTVVLALSPTAITMMLAAQERIQREKEV